MLLMRIALEMSCLELKIGLFTKRGKARQYRRWLFDQVLIADGQPLVGSALHLCHNPQTDLTPIVNPQRSPSTWENCSCRSNRASATASFGFGINQKQGKSISLYHPAFCAPYNHAFAAQFPLSLSGSIAYPMKQIRLFHT
jgi:hypothetical protein